MVQAMAFLLLRYPYTVFSVHLMNCYFPNLWYSHVTEKRTSEGRIANIRKMQDIMWEQSTLWESVEKRVTKYLKKNHSEYRELQVKAMRIVDENPALRILINSMEGIVLTPEDHKALHKYIETKDEMTIFEYEYYYLAFYLIV